MKSLIQNEFVKLLGVRALVRLLVSFVVISVALLLLDDVSMMSFLVAVLATIGMFLATEAGNADVKFSALAANGWFRTEVKTLNSLVYSVLTALAMAFILLASVLLFPLYASAMGSNWLPFVIFWGLIFQFAVITTLVMGKRGYQPTSGKQRLAVNVASIVIALQGFLFLLGVMDVVRQIVSRAPSLFPVPAVLFYLVLGFITPLLFLMIRLLLGIYYSVPSVSNTETRARPAFQIQSSTMRKVLHEFKCHFPFGNESDSAFDVEDDQRQYLGEVGVGIRKDVQGNNPGFCFAFDFWLFDRHDTVTYTKSLVTPGAAKLGWLDAIPDSSDASKSQIVELSTSHGWGVDVACQYSLHAGNGDETFETAEFTFTVWQLED